MIRVPSPLIEAVQKLSRLHRLGHKNAVLQGLRELISTIDSSSDIDFGASDEAIKQLALRLEKLESHNSSDSNVDSVLKSVASLEQKLEAIQTRIAQMEGAIALLGQRQQTSPTRRQAFNYHPPQVKLQPYNGENLAKRLGIDVATVESQIKCRYLKLGVVVSLKRRYLTLYVVKYCTVWWENFIPNEVRLSTLPNVDDHNSLGVKKILLHT